MSRNYSLGMLNKFFFTIALSLVQVTSIHADNPAEAPPKIDDDLTDMSLEQLMTLEIDTVYTASKSEQPVTEAPSSISIITADDIATYGYQDLADILAGQRGFHVTRDRNYEYVGVRGFGLPADYNSRMLLLIDGVRQNDTIYDAAIVGSEVPVDIHDIKRIEIVRGPSSSVYGSSAFFAVINIITKDVQDQLGLNVSLNMASFENNAANLSYGREFTNGSSLFVSGSYMDKQGDDLYFPVFDDPETNNGIVKNRDGSRIDKLMIKGTYNNFSVQALYSFLRKQVPTAPWGGLFGGNLFTDDEELRLDLEYDKNYDNNSSVVARINYSEYNYYGEYPYEGDTDYGEDPIVVNLDSANASWIYGEIQYTRPLANAHSITVGGTFTNNLQQDQKTEYVGAEGWGFYEEDRDSSNWGMYLQGEFHLSPKFLLSAGLRHDSFDSFGNTINPRLAMIYSIREASIVKVIYGTAFRAPSDYELYYNDGGATTKPSPSLDPETIQSFELVFEHYFSAQLSGSVSLYHNALEDLITQIEAVDDICDFGDPCLIFENLDKVEARGVEFELARTAVGGVNYKANYSFQETENKSGGTVLSNSPRHLANLAISIPLLNDKLRLAIEQRYVGERKTILRDMVDAYALTNVTLSSGNWLRGLYLSAKLYNLFDEEYFDPGAGEHAMDQIEQDGRTFSVRMQYSF